MPMTAWVALALFALCAVLSLITLFVVLTTEEKVIPAADKEKPDPDIAEIVLNRLSGKK